MVELKLLYWHWWIIGLVLVVGEGLMPSGIFASMAIGGLVAGTVSWIIPGVSTPIQLALFTTTMLVSLISIRYVRKKTRMEARTDRTDPKDYIGREFTLTASVQNGYSEIELDGIVWTLKGPELKAGDRVRVVDTDTDILVIYPLDRKFNNEGMP